MAAPVPKPAPHKRAPLAITLLWAVHVAALVWVAAPALTNEGAAERLQARIDGDSQPPQTYVVPSELIQRGSGEIPPAAG